MPIQREVKTMDVKSWVKGVEKYFHGYIRVLTYMMQDFNNAPCIDVFMSTRIKILCISRDIYLILEFCFYFLVFHVVFEP